MHGRSHFPDEQAALKIMSLNHTGKGPLDHALEERPNAFDITFDGRQ